MTDAFFEISLSQLDQRVVPQSKDEPQMRVAFLLPYILEGTIEWNRNDTNSIDQMIMGEDKYHKNRFPSIWSVLLSAAALYRRCFATSRVRIFLGLLLVGALRLSYVLLAIQQPLQLPNTEPWQLPAESLQAIIYFKEESHALVEVLLHLFSQGVSHVRLVDNDSKLEVPDVVKEFEKRGLVTLRKEKRKGKQKHVYMVGYQKMRRHADWVMAMDADEFPYATKMGSLLNYLVAKDAEVCSIALPMMFFGASGREEQPNSIIQGFLQRRNFTQVEEPRLGYKSTSRTSCTMWAAVHHAANFPSQELRTYNSQHGFPRNKKPVSDQFTEEHFPDAVVNHYRTQSAHFYRTIKATRGNATPNPNKKRTMSIFDANNADDNKVTDDRLSTMARQRFPALYSGKVENALALESNEPLTNPWPRENTMKALEQLARHQGLAILDGASGIPGQLGGAFRNAAILDPTWDCIVRVPSGHVVSVIGSGLTKFCATREAVESKDFKDFVATTVQHYGDKYTAYAAMDAEAILSVGADTAGLREAAKSVTGKQWLDWAPKDKENNVSSGRIRLVPKLFS